MKRLLCLLLLTTLTGCGSFLIQNPNLQENEVTSATTNVDAVEGDKEEDTGIIDTLRGRSEPISGDPAWAPIHPKEKPEHYAAATGSLFNVDHAQDMYDDTKPRGLGDIVTVMLAENTKAAKSADAELSKKNDSSMDPLQVGGQELQVGGQYNFSYELSNDNKFTGNTSANQSNSLSGSITVEVIEVLSNGNLLIRGEKWLTLNTGDEYIRLSGTIRPDDIAFDNTIASTRISNARIQYSGTGDQQDMQEPGFLARFFNVAL
ncbi:MULTISPECIES: flagellar basal body L-ring protein FlgH [Aliivibrio]|jgi:flagellar L-ring protein precursor FlgH|uniref:Flagellar L-ring protein n=3 Tax=Aliivibrio TaxID=511678 RepID=FLGH_ALISL|nr:MULTISPECIES: flagellar basal body L-ring protein FlgH [Aliivibrio]B6EJG2.1 RecName: Full=Flagellar L-ring protein; AltName: Full=Basal body L-ring protein; Flags: Precursor [Aliivibrio salmonicida LFI1238]AZL85479.1 flagellar basal body L-ring protein FlgH [Aliivibrio salmonicida]MBB1315217.1 flagellar basal body L-ring protein FlgH [Aliivibrio sp. SR45-2]OCH22462.1 flagellar basal body L-ring protein [Aliivibrio logei]OEF19917.1 flagellar basal body L-ring protein [Aliivibrio logei 5S-186